MRIWKLASALSITLLGCARSPHPPSVTIEDDKSIIFPQFSAQEATMIGTDGKLYELDGEMLRALMIVANDFAPPGGPDQPCWSRPEANSYRVLRQGNILFVYVHENPKYCNRPYPSFDSGAKYAISIDGRILRRVMDGQPTGLFNTGAEDAGDIGELAEPGVLPRSDASGRTSPTLEQADGGPKPSFSAPLPAPSNVPDAGT